MGKNKEYKALKRELKKARFENTLLRGVGASTIQDRAAQNTSEQYTMHPYYNNNHLSRWQEYVRWYMTSWEARKIVDIPVNDALREPVKLVGLKEADEKLIWEAYEEFDVERQLRRALIQERLLGGAVILPVFVRNEHEETETPLDKHSLMRGDLQALNVIDVARLSRPFYSNDPFDVYYDKIEKIQINSTIVHTSRMCLFDGDPLFNFPSQRVMENYRFNPVGFGESVLTTLYDALIRATGTQQGAYHLVNLSSCLIIACKQLRSLIAAGSPAKAKLEELAEQISIYRAAIVDADNVEFKQHATTFGSVPELVLTYLQILSAGSDIPATRFLGQAPGGLNATGESDLENYYNGIESWLRKSLRPRQTTIFDWLGSTIWGFTFWKIKSKDLCLEYPSLWNLDEVQQSQVDLNYANLIKDVTDLGLIDQQSAINELVERKIFKTDVKAGDFLTQEAQQAESPFGDSSMFGGEGTGGKPTKQPIFNAPKKFEESKIKRDEGGKFTSTGSKGSTGITKKKEDLTEQDKEALKKRKEEMAKERENWPEHIKALKLPDWKNIEYNETANPSHGLLATGFDTKGRKQYAYTKEHVAKAKDEKFGRVGELDKKYSEIEKKLAADLQTNDHAKVAYLIAKMGVRPGSEKDTKAEKEAIGATTLKGQHVVVTKDGVSLQFTGKKGVDLDLPVMDKTLQKMLKDAKINKGEDGKLFDTNEKKVNAYLKQFGAVSAKDFRTRLGTDKAKEIVNAMPVPKNEKELKKAQKEVAKKVSAILGNTPEIALKAYINPSVFAQWETSK